MKVLNFDRWCPEALKIISEVATLTDVPFDSPGGILASLKPVTEQMLDYLKPKWIATCTTGTDHLPMKYCEDKGIKVIYLDDKWKQNEGREVRATAEHTIALMLALIRKVPFAHNDVCAGNWEREKWQGTELYGKTLGIVGYGRVGKMVAGYAEAFGLRVLSVEKYERRTNLNKIVKPIEEHYIHKAVKNLLKISDIITVHVPLNESTKGMFGEQEFIMMKPTAYFINTSRGAVVDEVALLRALVNRQIAGAALDVLCGEPNIKEYWRDYARENNNLILTPHIGGNTAESRKATQIYIANRIKEYIMNAERSV